MHTTISCNHSIPWQGELTKVLVKSRPINEVMVNFLIWGRHPDFVTYRWEVRTCEMRRGHSVGGSCAWTFFFPHFSIRSWIRAAALGAAGLEGRALQNKKLTQLLAFFSTKNTFQSDHFFIHKPPGHVFSIAPLTCNSGSWRLIAFPS